MAKGNPGTPRGPRGVGRYKPEAGFKTIIPAVGWWAIFDGTDGGEYPLVCWALIGGSVVGMAAFADTPDGIGIPEECGTFVRYEYRP